MEISGKIMQYMGQPAVLSIARDITQSKAAENKLQRKTDELERFNRLAVGRELRMIELKKQISRLEKGGGERG